MDQRALARASHPGDDDQYAERDFDVDVLQVVGAGAGYLDTGPADVVFPEAPKVTIYSGWRYVLVEAGADQALSWRRDTDITPWHSALPELLLPADRSWLISTMWDDDWRYVGGPAGVVAALLHHPDVDARAVALGAAATPPRHEAI